MTIPTKFQVLKKYTKHVCIVKDKHRETLVKVKETGFVQ